MTEFSTLGCQVNDGVAQITLNRPKAMNSLNHVLRMEFRKAIQLASNNEQVRVIVLSGEGKGFCAGADLAEFSRENPELSEPGYVTHLIRTEYNPVLTSISESPKPVICAVHGAAAGIGASIALACDLIVMSEEAYFYSPFGAISLVPDGGLHWQLSRFLGTKKAYEMIVESQRLDAKRCEALGIANRVVAEGDHLAAALDWASSLVKKAPLTMRYSKQMLRELPAMTLQQCMDREAQVQDIPFQSNDFEEGVMAFMEKRAPQFSGK